MTMSCVYAGVAFCAAIAIAGPPLRAAGCAGQPNGTACDDGNGCTVGESCRSQICVAPASFVSAAGSPIAVGDAPNAVASGDWNGDGKLDLAVANSQNSPSITILLGNGSGAFTQAAGSPIATSFAPYAIAVGDWNGDAKLDLAVANFGANTVTILLGNGTGGFAQASGSPIAVADGPFDIVTADLNADGKLDLAVANWLANKVTILLGNGAGGFSPASGSPIAVGTGPSSIAIRDLSGDGKPDLAVANKTSNNVSILLGSGTGTFVSAPGSPIAVGALPESIVAGDWNLDGAVDLAVANQAASANSVTILMGDGTGGFAEPSGSPYPAGTNPFAVVAGDFNGDGRPDLAVANEGSNNVTVLLGDGGGRFAEPSGSPISVGPLPRSLCVGDWNGDGGVDLAVANSDADDVSILLDTATTAADGTACEDGNPCTVGEACRAALCVPPLALSSLLSASTRIHPYAIAVGDVNRDGHPDLAVPNEDTNNVSILFGNGAGAFGPNGLPEVQVGSRPQAIAMGDLNNDGKLDLAVPSRSSSNLWILIGNGSGGFSAPNSPIFLGPNPNTIVAGRIDGDANLDLAVGGFGSNTVWILLGDGSGGFTQPPGSTIPLGGSPIALAAADLNLDGKLDLVVVDTSPNELRVYLGNGAGSFTQAPGSPITVGSSPSAVAAGDFDADGWLDLAVTDSVLNSVAVLRGNGSGRFSLAGARIGVGAGPEAIATADLNGDGKLDLVTANSSSGNVTILLGRGGGAFDVAPSSPVAAGLDPIAVAVSDFTHDGKADIAAVNHNSNTVTIIVNATSAAPLGTACNDGDMCTVGETCSGWSCQGGAAASCDDGDVCTDDACSPDAGCVHTSVARDADADGHVDAACGGDDCDDAHAATFPGAAEVNDGLDNQCAGNPGFGVVDEVRVSDRSWTRPTRPGCAGRRRRGPRSINSHARPGPTSPPAARSSRSRPPARSKRPCRLRARATSISCERSRRTSGAGGRARRGRRSSCPARPERFSAPTRRI